MAEARPDALALVSPEAAWTYDELNRYANRIANAVILAHGDRTRALATLQDDGAAQIAALLAACKTGRRYVPIDTRYPVPRGAFILDDVDADILITDAQNEGAARAMAEAARTLIDVDAGADSLPDSNPGIAVAPDAPLWVMYTSGTTGEPKGVLQTHRNLLHYVGTYAAGFSLGPATRLLTLMSLTANGGCHDALMTLLTGGTLLPWNARRHGVAELPAWIDRQRSTILSASPTAFRQLVAGLAPSQRLAGLRLVKLWAEPAHRRDFDAFREHFADDAVLVNRLGSTEQGSTLWCFLRKHDDFEGLHVPVGYPAEDPSVLLLDDEGNRVADGQIGEIVARSRFLSPGYWKRDRETAAAFSTDPDDPSLRRYRTGDLGYRRADGCMVCVGRKDAQIKIRGFRVEPAEIEQALLANPVIHQAFVTAWTDAERAGEPRLVAYYVAAPEARVSAAELRQFVAARLPDYMVPAALVRMERFPQSPNGKVLRREFPDPGDHRPDLDVSYRAPANEIEAALVGVWTEVLRQDGIGVDDQFLDLGGDSLQAMSIAARVVERFALDCSPAEVLAGSTIAAMAEAIGSRSKASADERAISSSRAATRGE
jgi:amino acid adenylation domain-containing protein